MLDLDKINAQFENLKNMDAQALSAAVKEHQNAFIKLVLVAGTLFLAGAIYNAYRAQDLAAHTRIKLLGEKIAAVKARDIAIQGIVDFKSSLRKKLNEFELITVVSNYAKECHVTISSLSPAESQDMGLYDLVNINLNAMSGDFKGLVLFLRKIEKSEYSLRVNTWIGNENASGNITFSIQISAVIVHT